jgi:hypothetical protein
MAKPVIVLPGNFVDKCREVPTMEENSLHHA